MAVPQTDGSYKLHGFKWFTSATDADMTLTLARIQDRTGATTPVLLTADTRLPARSVLFNNLQSDFICVFYFVCACACLRATGQQGFVFVLRRGEQRRGRPAEGYRGPETERQAGYKTDANRGVTAGWLTSTQGQLHIIIYYGIDKQ